MPRLILSSAFAMCAAMLALAGCDKVRGADCVGETARDGWISLAVDERGHMESPHDNGFRATGECSLALTSKHLECDRTSILAFAEDSPYLRQALQLGFQFYDCDLIGGETTRFDLREIAARPEPRSKPVPVPRKKAPPTKAVKPSAKPQRQAIDTVIDHVERLDTQPPATKPKPIDPFE